jgi:hypothetical protein
MNLIIPLFFIQPPEVTRVRGPAQNIGGSRWQISTFLTINSQTLSRILGKASWVSQLFLFFVSFASFCEKREWVK